MRCLETRDRNGITYRRYRTDDGRTIRTLEVPETVLKAFGLKRVREALASWQRGEAQRARRVEIERLIAQGVKPLAIADAVGVTEQRVRQIRKELE